MEETGPGSLKLVVATDDDDLQVVLEEWISRDSMRRILPGIWVVYTVFDVSELRERIGTRMDDEFFFALEFERWSALGQTIDTEWLLRRGH